MRLSTFAIPAGPVFAMIVYLSLPSQYTLVGAESEALAEPARLTLAMTAWMALWWLTEALPVAVTALIPIAAFPLLQVHPLAAVCAAYAHPLIFLFLGGFLLALGVEKWHLHSWLAGRVVAAAGGDLRRLVGGFMGVAAAASMWLSNTATAIMMLPIAGALIAAHDQVVEHGRGDCFARCVLLAVAYGASIGGTATLIGSPPNLFVASYLNEHFGSSVDFRTWMLAALPVCILLLPATWFVLTRYLAPVSGYNAALTDAVAVAASWRELSPAARRVAAVFVLTVLAWLTRDGLNAVQIGGLQPFAALTDTAIAMLAGISLFALPAGVPGKRLLAWSDAEKLPYGTLILFGGGLALAATLTASGADRFIGAQLGALHGIPAWLVLVCIITAVVFLTELTSNTATTATLAPLLAAAATVLNLDIVTLVVVTALAASCAFMMPVATPPNAIVFASGRITIAEMARAGLIVNVLAIIVISALALSWIPSVIGVSAAR